MIMELEGWEQGTDSVLFPRSRQFSPSEQTLRCPDSAEHGIVTPQKVAPMLLSSQLSTEPLRSQPKYSSGGSEVMLTQAVLWREDQGEGGLLSQRAGREKGLEMQANPEKCGYFPPVYWHLARRSLGLLGEDITVSILASGLFGSQVLLDHFQSCYCKVIFT